MTEADGAADVLPSRRRRAWRLVLAGTVMVAVVAAGIGFARAVGRPQPVRTQAPPPATATVVRTTLTQVTDVDGTLGFDPPVSVVNRLQGTVTSVAGAGTTVQHGGALYAVDTKPVVLMYGSLPAYRTLHPGSVGKDVLQLEENLADLGYGGFIDDTYTDDTSAAVRSWQEDLGLPQTGTVELGRVVFLPGPRRIAQDVIQPGQLAAPGQPALFVTSSDRLVTANVDISDMGLVHVGGRVRVTLPSGPTVTGWVTGVGTVASSQGQAGSGGAPVQAPSATPGPSTTTIPVTITVTDQRALGGLDGSPVTVHLVGAQRTNVLAVPVAALLALRGGGYGVQVISGSASRDVPVNVGLFANGMVEVSGAGITEGTVVGMAAP